MFATDEQEDTFLYGPALRGLAQQPCRRRAAERQPELPPLHHTRRPVADADRDCVAGLAWVSIYRYAVGIRALRRAEADTLP